MTELQWQDQWRVASLAWTPAFRVIPTRFPAVNLFDRVASPEDFDALYALEAMTNDRVRTEVGDLDLVPREERRFGPGYGPIMAALTHLNLQGSRFSDGSYGVPEGLICSFPCRAVDGEWQIIQGVEINDFSRSKIDASVHELAEERDAVKGLGLI